MSSDGLPAPLRSYATEAIRQQAYRRLAGAKLKEFDEACRESREAAKRLMDAAGVDAALLPEQGVALRRVRKEVPGTITLRRLEVYTSTAVTPDEATTMAELARTVAREHEAAAEQVRAKAARAAELEQRRREREERAEAKRVAQEERARQSEARKAEAAARKEYERRMRLTQRELRHTFEEVI
jgi:hypothetical protein